VCNTDGEHVFETVRRSAHNPGTKLDLSWSSHWEADSQNVKMFVYGVFVFAAATD